MIETAVFFTLCGFTLWFSRWLTGKEIELAKATFRQDALNSALEVAKEREALAEAAKEALRDELDSLKRQKDNRRSIEANALPFFANTDREQAQIEKVMNDKGEEYFDEVAGLGR